MNSIDIWNDLGNLYLKANAITAAIDAFKKALDHGNRTADIYRKLAAAYIIQGNFGESIPLYLKSIELLVDAKEKAFTYTRIGDAYRRMSDYENAIAAFKLAIEIEPGNPALIVGLSEVQRDLEKMYGFDSNNPVANPAGSPTQEADLDSVSAQDSPVSFAFQGVEQPSAIEERVTRADTMTLPLVEISASQQAIWPVLESSLPLPGSANSGELSSKTKDQSNDELHPSAISTSMDDSTAEENNEFDPEKAEGVRATLLLTMGIMHWRNGNLEEADSILRSSINAAVKMENSWFEALGHNALALVKTAKGDIISAIHAYMRAAELAPDQLFPWNKLGNLYGKLGENDQAMEAFKIAIRQYPEDSTSWDGLGDIYTRLGRMEEALAAYQLGNAFDKQAKGSDAILTYEKAFDFYHMTISSFEQELTEAQRTLQGSTEGDLPNDVPVPVESQTSQKEVPSSIPVNVVETPIVELPVATHVEPFVEWTPSETSEVSLPISEAASQPAGVLSQQQPAHMEVETSLELAVTPKAETMDVLPPVVSVAPAPKSDLARVAGTIATYEAVVRENPRNDRAWDSLGHLYQINQRNADAIYAFERAVSLEPTKYVYHYQLGTLYAAQGNYRDAIIEIEKVVELNSDFIFAHCALASYLRKIGKHEEALKHISIAAPHMSKEKEYDQACFESIRGNVDQALVMLAAALEKKQTTIEFIRRDLDLDFIRSDSRYKLFEAKFAKAMVSY
jgi:tetratricopeptide (TPR) repeat protein